MTLIISGLGIALFLLLKIVVFQTEKGKELLSSLFGLAVDINLMGFMLGIVTISQLSAATPEASPAILISAILIVLSVFIWKLTCSFMSNRDGAVYYARPIATVALTVFNFLLSLAAVLIPLVMLGAKP